MSDAAMFGCGCIFDKWFGLKLETRILKIHFTFRVQNSMPWKIWRWTTMNDDDLSRSLQPRASEQNLTSLSDTHMMKTKLDKTN